MPEAATISKSSARDCAKCSHSAFDCVDALGLEQLLEQWDAGTARRARPGALLQGGYVRAAVGDRVDEIALGDVVAGTDLRGGGQRADAQLCCTGARSARRDDRERVAGKPLADHRPQYPVGGGIAHQDAAQQRGRVVGEDQLGVGLLDRVVDDHLEAVRRRAHRVAEAGHVDAQQLELGGHVRLTEFGCAAEQSVGHDFGTGVARPHQPVAATADRGHLTDRIDVGNAGGTARVGEDAAAVGDRKSRRARQFVARTHAGREDDQAGVDRRAVGRGSTRSPSIAAVRWTRCRRRRAR